MTEQSSSFRADGDGESRLLACVFLSTIRGPDYWLPVWAWHIINMLFRRCHSCTHHPLLVASTHLLLSDSQSFFFFFLSRNRWGEESHRKKIFILRWLAFTVSPFKWYFHSGGTTFPPERISFWNVYLFEIGDDTNIFIPFYFFAPRKGDMGAGAVNPQKILSQNYM